MWRLSEMLEAGTPLESGSYWPVLPSTNPWNALETLGAREYPGGSAKGFGMDAAIRLEDAFQMFTENAAKQEGAAPSRSSAAG